MTQGFVTDTPISTDTGLLPSSNNLVPSQLAVKTYVDAQVSQYTTEIKNAQGAYNIGISYSSGTGVFTVRGANAALSASNPGYITLQSKSTPGELVTITVTADQSFIDDNGASEIIGNLFGVTTGVAWGEDMPFFIYAVLNDAEDTIAFMISRDPSAAVSPAAANIGDPGDPVADAQGDFWSIDTVTEADYESNPCLCIGAFRMRMSASDDWTVQTLSNSDGIGQFHEGTRFLFPTGQNGAASGTYIKSNAGTEPTWSGGGWSYDIDKTGTVRYKFIGITGVAGVGAQTLEPVLPYKARAGTQLSNIIGRWFDSSSGLTYILILLVGAEQDYVSSMFTSGSATTFQNVTIATGDGLQFEVDYKAF